MEKLSDAYDNTKKFIACSTMFIPGMKQTCNDFETHFERFKVFNGSQFYRCSGYVRTRSDYKIINLQCEPCSKDEHLNMEKIKRTAFGTYMVP